MSVASPPPASTSGRLVTIPPQAVSPFPVVDVRNYAFWYGARQALADLANKANFGAFWESHQAAYERYLHKTAENFRARMVVDWLSKFFGWHEKEFHLVLAPGLVPGGGYGATIRKSDGSEIIYQFIRENGKTEGEPEFPNGVSLEVLSLHEWGHAYVHTAFEKHR